METKVDDSIRERAERAAWSIRRRWSVVASVVEISNLTGRTVGSCFENLTWFPRVREREREREDFEARVTFSFFFSSLLPIRPKLFPFAPAGRSVSTESRRCRVIYSRKSVGNRLYGSRCRSVSDVYRVAPCFVSPKQPPPPSSAVRAAWRAILAIQRRLLLLAVRVVVETAVVGSSIESYWVFLPRFFFFACLF